MTIKLSMDKFHQLEKEIMDKGWYMLQEYYVVGNSLGFKFGGNFYEMII